MRTKLPFGLFDWKAKVEDYLVHHIGYCVVHWAIAETALADVIWMLEARSPGSIQSEMPLSLKRKLAYLRRAVTQGMFSGDLAVKAQALVAQFEANKDFRHLLAHGEVFLCEESLRFKAYNLKPREQSYTIERFEFGAEELLAEMHKIGDLCFEAQRFRMDVEDWAHKARPEE